MRAETRQALALTLMDAIDSAEPDTPIREWMDSDSNWLDFQTWGGCIFSVVLLEQDGYGVCFGSEAAFLDAFHNAVTELNETGYGKPMRT